MTLDEFRATASPITDALWLHLCEGDLTQCQRSAHTMYDGEYVLYEKDGQFWPFAWWYKPAPYPTKERAEEVLYEWRKEWV